MTKYQDWARKNFNPTNQDVDDMWHPEIQDECYKMIEEREAALREEARKKREADAVKRSQIVNVVESICDDGSIAIQSPPENFDHDPRFGEGGEFNEGANPKTPPLRELEIVLGGIRHILTTEDDDSTQEMVENALDLLEDAESALEELKRQNPTKEETK